MSRRRRPLLLAVALAAVVALLGSAQANASSLALSFAPFTMGSSTFARGCTGPAQVAAAQDSSGQYTKVVVTGLTGSCTTGHVGVAVSGGTVVAQGDAPVTNGGFTVTVPAYTPPSGTSGQVVVTTATWPVASRWVAPAVGFGTCAVVTAAGKPTSTTCTISSLKAVSNGDGHTAGSRTDQLYMTLAMSAPPGKNEQVLLVLNLAAATGLQSDWMWSTTMVYGGNLSAYPGQACSALPSLRAYGPSWSANGSSLYFWMAEGGAPARDSLCS